MKNEITKKEKLQDSLFEYYGNGITVEQVLINANIDPTDELEEIIAITQRGWDLLPCDDEGSTAEQELVMDNYVDNVVNDILHNLNLNMKNEKLQKELKLLVMLLASEIELRTINEIRSYSGETYGYNSILLTDEPILILDWMTNCCNGHIIIDDKGIFSLYENNKDDFYEETSNKDEIINDLFLEYKDKETKEFITNTINELIVFKKETKIIN